MYDYEFEPTPSDAEIFLSDEPINLLKQHIRSQFTDPMNYKFDYVGSYIESFRMSVLQVETDDDEDDLERMNDDFVRFMLNIFEKYLGLGFPDFEEKSYEEQHDILHMTYRYFIVNIKHNFSSFCLNYILRNKKELSENQPKKKDVSSLNLKRDGIEADDIVIISNLYDIIQNIIFGQDHDVDEFILNSDVNDPRLETDMMNEYFENFTVTGNFYPEYRKMLNTPFIKEIESKIRNKILKSYKKKLEKGEKNNE